MAKGPSSFELQGQERKRVLVVAGCLFGITALVFLLTAPRGIASQHTAFNHFALLADAWLEGRLDLGGPPPSHTHNNDFAVWGGKTYVSFPPFPALLLLPLVALSGGPNIPDGLVFLLAGALAPAILFLALERLRAAHLSSRSERENVVIALLLPFATVFWFSAVQGTVWFAAHAVGVSLAAAFLWASVGAKNPLLAGLFLVCGFATRTPLALAAPIFLHQLLVAARDPVAPGPRSWGLARDVLRTKALRFAVPIVLGLCLLGWLNHTRFGSALEFGHRHLDVVWQPRIQKWGLFSLHYLGKNLGVALASTPFLQADKAPLQISYHGLALWITSPFLLLALWPRTMPTRARPTFLVLTLTTAAIALVDLCYHNTGWVQFGYRFSNDYIVFLLAMLALGRRRLGWAFRVLAGWAVVVNLFGALTFQRPEHARFYRAERANIYFEPD